MLPVRKDLEGGFYTTHWYLNANNPKAQQFVQAYRLAYNQLPQNDAALTYDAVGLLFQALRNQGKVDSESIRLGLSQIQRYEGVSGTANFKGTGDPIKSAAILQIKKSEPVFYKQVNPN